MDQTALVESDIDLGRRALRAFDASELDVPATLWLYVPEAGEWRLVVATPLVDREGPKPAYARIARILRQQGLAEVLPLRRIAAVGPNDQLIRLLRKVAKTGPGVSGIRFTSNTINNVVIDDAYIYRVN